MKTKIITIMRWISVLPGAILTSWISWLIVKYACAFASFSFPVDLHSFWGRLFIEAIGTIIMTCCFIASGYYIAPKYKLLTVYALSTLAMLCFIYILIPALLVLDFSSILISICILNGVIWTCVPIRQYEREK